MKDPGTVRRAAGVPQTLAWLAGSYPVFGLRALRPALGAAPGSLAAWGGFLAIATGERLRR